MRLYVELAKRSFQRQLAYRTAALAGLGTNAFWGVLRSYLFLGLYGAQGVVTGWSAHDALNYVWLAQALIMPLSLFGWWEAGETIRTGDAVADLTKPFDYYHFWLSREIGRALYNVAFRFVPTIIIGLSCFQIGLPGGLDGWLWFGLSLSLAFWISFGIRFLFNLTAFWVLDYRYAGSLLLLPTSLLSGFLVPLNYFPDWARSLIGWLPFASVVQTPVEIWLGKASGSDLALLIVLQLTWGVVLMLACRLVVTLGERKLVVQGG